MKQILSKIPRHIIFGLLTFAVIAFATIFLFHGEVNSPDEAANTLFITSWRERGELSVRVPVEQPQTYPLFPRSTMPVGQYVVPSAFVGLPILFGSISVIAGAWSPLYMTVLLTLVAALGWWYVMRHIFGRAVADISFWLFLFHPAVIYYSVRGLFPNMLMMDLIVIAIAAAWYAYLHHTKLMWVLSGIAAVLACAVRPPESLVVFAMVCVAALIWGDRRVRKLCGRILAVIGSIGTIFLMARSYGLIPGGYTFVEINSLSSLIFPFGINIARVWHTAIAFIIRLFAPWVMVSTAGVVWWFWNAYKTRAFDKRIAAYLTVIVPVSFWLFILYGSWSFVDNLADAHAVTLGGSYVRYWLPHLLFRMPFAAVLLFVVIEQWKLPAQKVARGFVAVMVVFGLLRAYVGVDGLQWLITEVRESRATASAVIARVPANAVLAVRAWDKFVFPERAVLQPFPRDVRTFGAVHELLQRGTPVYAFIETVKETDRLWLRDNDVAAEEVAAFGVQTLYKLSVWNSAR